MKTLIKQLINFRLNEEYDVEYQKELNYAKEQLRKLPYEKIKKIEIEKNDDYYEFILYGFDKRNPKNAIRIYSFGLENENDYQQKENLKYIKELKNKLKKIKHVQVVEK